MKLCLTIDWQGSIFCYWFLFFFFVVLELKNRQIHSIHTEDRLINTKSNWPDEARTLMYREKNLAHNFKAWKRFLWICNTIKICHQQRTTHKQEMKRSNLPKQAPTNKNTNSSGKCKIFTFFILKNEVMKAHHKDGSFKTPEHEAQLVRCMCVTGEG